METWSSWKSEDDKPFSSILNVVKEIPTENDNEILNLLEEDKCISLNNVDDKTECSLFINVNQNDLVMDNAIGPQPFVNFVTDVLLISETKTVEVFINSYQEYYKTFQSIIISNLEDTKIYKTLISLPKPEKSILLKLKGLYCKDNVWIYGIFIKIKTDFLSPSMALHSEKCCANNLDSLLKERNVVLSEKAENFKKMYSLYNLSQSKFAQTLPFNNVLPFTVNTNKLKSFKNIQNIGETNNSESAENCNLKDIKNPLVTNSQHKLPTFSCEEMVLKKMQNLMFSKNSCLTSLHQFIPSIPQNSSQFNESSVSQKDNDGCSPNIVSQHMAEILPNKVTNFLSGEEQNVTNELDNRLLISSVLEPLIEQKLNELEIKLKAQLEESHQIIYKKLSCIEDLMMKIIDGKNS